MFANKASSVLHTDNLLALHVPNIFFVHSCDLSVFIHHETGKHCNRCVLSNSIATDLWLYEVSFSSVHVEEWCFWLNNEKKPLQILVLETWNLPIKTSIWISFNLGLHCTILYKYYIASTNSEFSLHLTAGLILYVLACWCWLWGIDCSRVMTLILSGYVVKINVFF